MTSETTCSIMSQQEYRSYIDSGYIKHRSNQCYRFGSKGRYVYLRKPQGICSRITKATACCFLCPFALTLTVLTCCQQDTYTCKPCWNHLLDPAAEGYIGKSGFIKDRTATNESRERDFEALGIKNYNQNKSKAYELLVNSGKFPIIRSAKYPQHCFITFYGPTSKVSFILLIPFGDVKKCNLYSCWDAKAGLPLNTEALNKRAEIQCGGYRPGATKASATMVSVLQGTSTFSTPYGTMKGKLYTREQRIVSS